MLKSKIQLRKPIAVIGADLVGKTTLCTALAEFFNVPLRGRIKRVPKRWKRYMAFFNDVNVEPTILDRTYLTSDWVYEPLVANRTSPFRKFSSLWFYVLNRCCHVVYVKCTLEDLEARYLERGDDIQSWDTISKAWWRYEHLVAEMKAEGVSIITVNTSGMDAEHCLNWIEDSIDLQYYASDRGIK